MIGRHRSLNRASGLLGRSHVLRMCLDVFLDYSTFRSVSLCADDCCMALPRDDYPNSDTEDHKHNRENELLIAHVLRTA